MRNGKAHLGYLYSNHSHLNGLGRILLSRRGPFFVQTFDCLVFSDFFIFFYFFLFLFFFFFGGEGGGWGHHKISLVIGVI